MLWLLALACKEAPQDSAPTALCGGAQGEVPALPGDDSLRFNQVQALGTHNSYHLEPEAVFDPSHAYSHAPLAEQLGQHGVRQLELDVHWRDEGGFDVLHIPVLDQETSCLALEDCLCAVRDFSDANPGHMPLVIWIEPKDDVDALAEGYEPLAGHLLALDEVIRAVWPPERLIEPDEVRGSFPSLPEAIAAQGWPSLGAMRGRVLFALLDTGEARAEYVGDRPNLEGRAIFVDNDDLTDPSAAMFKIDDAIGDAELMRSAIDAGFVVTCNVDGPEDDDQTNAAQLAASLDIGAHFLSTNYPAPVEDRSYYAEIPGGQPARCNPVTAATGCEASEIEALP